MKKNRKTLKMILIALICVATHRVSTHIAHAMKPTPPQKPTTTIDEKSYVSDSSEQADSPFAISSSPRSTLSSPQLWMPTADNFYQKQKKSLSVPLRRNPAHITPRAKNISHTAQPYRTPRTIFHAGKLLNLMQRHRIPMTTPHEDTQPGLMQLPKKQANFEQPDVPNKKITHPKGKRKPVSQDVVATEIIIYSAELGSIEESKIIKDGANSEKNIAEIRKRLPNQPIIAVCPTTSPTYFYRDIKAAFFQQYNKCLLAEPDKKPIIYFGRNVYFEPNAFANQEIDADIIIYGSGFTQLSFHDNTINGMCILFEPAMNTERCFSANKISEGLFIVGTIAEPQRRFPISSTSKTWYLFGDNLISLKNLQPEKITSGTFLYTLSKALELLLKAK